MPKKKKVKSEVKRKIINVLNFLFLSSESEVAQSCPTLCDPMDCSLPASSLHGILQARVLEWIAISFSRGSTWPRDWTRVSHIPGRHFNLWATREALNYLLENPLHWDVSMYEFGGREGGTNSQSTAIGFSHEHSQSLCNYCLPSQRKDQRESTRICKQPHWLFFLASPSSPQAVNHTLASFKSVSI